MFTLFAAAEEAGALAAYLSGGGPTVCALTMGNEAAVAAALQACAARAGVGGARSEEHTSELQSQR